MTDRRRLGDAGEDMAAHLLVEHGLSIHERNVRTASGEIDIVARDGDTVVFVEVRTRRAGSGDAALSLTRAKLRRMRRCALEYCSVHGIDPDDARIDVVAIDLPGRRPGPRAATHYRAIEIPD